MRRVPLDARLDARVLLKPMYVAVRREREREGARELEGLIYILCKWFMLWW